MALPLAKLGLMGLKVITKPIANEVKSQAKTNPAFKNLCIRFGRGINSMTVWANNITLNRTPAQGSKRFVLNETQAIERGADAVGELATFFLIGVPVVGVYWYESAEKDRDKEKKRLQDEEKERQLNLRFELVDQQLQVLTSELAAARQRHEEITQRLEQSAAAAQRNRSRSSSTRAETAATDGGIDDGGGDGGGGGGGGSRRWWSPWGVFG